MMPRHISPSLTILCYIFAGLKRTIKYCVNYSGLYILGFVYLKYYKLLFLLYFSLVVYKFLE